MKTKIFLVMFVISLFYGCEQDQQPVHEEKHSFAKVIRNPSDYQQPIGHQTFTGGIVVFKKANDEKGILVVADSSILKLHRELRDDEVIGIKVKPSTVQKINIGDVIDVSGWTTLAETEDSEFYYVIASTVAVVGKVNVEDPDFGKIVAAITAKSNQGWDLMDIILVYAVYNLLFDDD